MLPLPVPGAGVPEGMETPRDFNVVLEPQEEGGYTAYVPELRGCVSEGDTREEALGNIKEAIAGYVESLEAHGDPPASPRRVRARNARYVSRRYPVVRPGQLMRVLARGLAA